MKDGHDHEALLPQAAAKPRGWRAWLGCIFTPAVLFAASFVILITASTSYVVTYRLEPSPMAVPILRLDSHNELSLAIFSDLHFGEEESGWGIDQDINSTRVMNNVLDREHPNLVVFNGDLITGENTQLHNSTHYIDAIVKPLVDRGLPWASTYGNHDSDFNLSREALFSAEARYELSLTRHSQRFIRGVTNYYIPIYPQASAPNAHKPAMLLWFFDSRGGKPFLEVPKFPITNWMDQSEVTWFKDARFRVTELWGELPSIAFVHIPPRSFLNFQQTDFSAEHFPGLNADVPLATQGTTDHQEDKPFMDELISTPGLHSIYAGHDHGNAWCGNWLLSDDQIANNKTAPHLCFCKHTGYGGYGDWHRGSRIVKLAFDAAPANGGNLSVETWVRMENGDVVTHVHLNSTYGTDIYPTADGE